MEASQVRLLEEWLCLNGYKISIDSGIIGPEVKTACIAIAPRLGLKSDDFKGILSTLASLLTRTVTTRSNAPTVQQRLIDVAEAYLAAKAREVGGNNRGPWVRYFTGGHEGNANPWCCTCATTLLLQAEGSWLTHKQGSSSALYALAKKNGKLLDKPEPGCLFALKKAGLKPLFKTHIHTGIVVDVTDGAIITIEGNAAPDGNVTDGTAVDGVYRHIRALTKRFDFIKAD